MYEEAKQEFLDEIACLEFDLQEVSGLLYTSYAADEDGSFYLCLCLFVSVTVFLRRRWRIWFYSCRRSRRCIVTLSSTVWH